MIIDAHAHFVPPAFLDEVASGRRFVSVGQGRGRKRCASALHLPETMRSGPLPGGMSDAEGRKRWLAERGIDKQVVGGWLDLFGYDMPADEGADWARFPTSTC